MNTSEIKAIVESVLFVAGAPVSLRRLAEIIGVAQAEVKPAMGQLMAEYATPERGVRLAEVAGGYQFRTAAENTEYIRKFVQEKPSKLSRASLETLAIIAYRQPLTKAEIEAVRGVDVDGVLNSLLTKKLVRVMGRKDVPGRPWVYGTTPQFLELFGLNDLGSLPPLPEIHEPTQNPFSEDLTDGTIAEIAESGGDLLAPNGGDLDPSGTGASEWRNGHPSGDDGGPAA
jgi:segregation and condensation protein B